MYELVVNLHMHTTYSDGSGKHEELARAAINSNIDVIIITDHNVLVHGLNGYRDFNGKRTLLLVGEEIHDQALDPQKNHLLAFGISEEVSIHAGEPQNLIDFINQIGGLSFIAHPTDLELRLFNESNISWENWNIKGFTGIEIWNSFSEIKNVITGKLSALLYGFFPELIAHGPTPKTIQIWDDLLSRGQHIVAIGGSDSHALPMRFGPIKKVIFPYQFHFSTINTHILTTTKLSGDLPNDSKMIYQALSSGHAFVGYDLPATTKEFRFFANNKNQKVIMGDDIELNGSVTIQVHTPGGGETSLIKDGKIIQKTRNPNLIHNADEPGIYRVEVHRNFLGKRRGWIYSNPIYIIDKINPALRKNASL